MPFCQGPAWGFFYVDSLRCPLCLEKSAQGHLVQGRSIGGGSRDSASDGSKAKQRQVICEAPSGGRRKPIPNIKVVRIKRL